MPNQSQKAKMKTKLPFLITVCLGAMALGLPASGLAKGKKTADTDASPSPAASVAAKKARPTSYHGKVAAVDASAKTFMVGKRTITVTGDTVITKQGASATIADIVVDEQVRGSYWKKEGGTLEAKSVKLGPKSETPANNAQKKEGKASAELAPSAAPKP